MARRALFTLVAVAIVPLLGCGRKQENDTDARLAWVDAETARNKQWLRNFLIGTKDVRYFDGWYQAEFDTKTGAGWRWQGIRSITRLRTHIEGRPPCDMKLTIYGWTAYEHVDVRTSHMEFMINGHVVDRLEPPREQFVHTIDVPRWLLGDGEWVDLVINVANSGVPRGDWRELAFATTGIIWKPADQP